VCRSGKKIFTFFLLYYFFFVQYLYAYQTRCHISMVVGNATTIVTSTVPSLARLGSAITSKTRQRHHVMTNVVSTAPSPARLGNDITPRPTSPRQCHHLHDSAMISRHAITNMTRQRHCQQELVATSCHIRRRLDSTIASMTRQQHRAMTNVDSATSSPTRPGNDITPRPMSPWQHCHQHDSGAWPVLF
jgi:hypothetical protein